MNKLVVSRQAMSGEVVVRVASSDGTKVRALTEHEMCAIAGLLEEVVAERVIDQSVQWPLQGAPTTPLEYFIGLSERPTSEVKGYVVMVERRQASPDATQDFVIVKIALAASPADVHDRYLIDSTGVVNMGCMFPPLVNISPAPTQFPADMSEAQASALAKLRAEEVMEFVQALHGP